MHNGYGQAQRGAVLPLVAICLAVLMGFAGMAIDVGFLEYKEQVQQAATMPRLWAAPSPRTRTLFEQDCGDCCGAVRCDAQWFHGRQQRDGQRDAGSVDGRFRE